MIREDNPCRPADAFRKSRKKRLRRSNSGIRSFLNAYPLRKRGYPRTRLYCFPWCVQVCRISFLAPISVYRHPWHRLSCLQNSSCRICGILCLYYHSRVIPVILVAVLYGISVSDHVIESVNTFLAYIRALCSSSLSGWPAVINRSHSSSEIFFDFLTNSCRLGARLPWHSKHPWYGMFFFLHRDAKKEMQFSKSVLLYAGDAWVINPARWKGGLSGSCARKSRTGAARVPAWQGEPMKIRL